MIKKYLSLLFVAFLLLFASCAPAADPGTEGQAQDGDSENSETESDLPPPPPAPPEPPENPPEEVEIERAETQTGQTEPEDAIAEVITVFKGFGAYDRPGGETIVQVNLHLDEEGVVEDYELIMTDGDDTSANFIEKFSSGLGEHVIGKTLDEIDAPAKISGSSLTSGGFEEALQEIKDKQ